MNFFKQTTLVGIGLIGSSIARALKKKRLSKITIKKFLIWVVEYNKVFCFKQIIDLKGMYFAL